VSVQDARQLLIDWANDQQHWARSIVRDVLVTRQPLSDQAMDEAYENCLLERDLREGKPPEVPKLSLSGDGDEATERLTIRAIRDVENVNRLASGQEIIFNPRLTVLFGENATGKSGYVRVLKRVAAVRAAEEILPDIGASSPSGPPKATLDFRIGSTDDRLQWSGEAGARPFTRISIFDTRAMAFHVDEDLTYVYTPRDLALFQYVHQGIGGVRERLERARDQARPSGNPFLPRLKQGSTVYAKVESLSPATDLAQLEAIAEVHPDEESQLTLLRDTVEALRPQVVQSRLELARSDRDLYNSILSTAQSVRDVEWSAYNRAIQDAQAAEARYADATETAFAGVDIPGVLSDTWRKFIAAADEYVNDLGSVGYPATDEKCIYCRQDLGDAAVELIHKYRAYANNELKVAIEQARGEAQSAVRGVTGLRVPALADRLLQKREAAGNGGGTAPLLVVEASLQFLESFAPVAVAIDAGAPIDNAGGVVEQAARVAELAEAARGDAESLVASLQTQGAEREREFTEQSSHLRELEDRLTLKELLPALKNHVVNQQWAQRADTIIRDRFPPLLRSLTAQSKVASEDLLNQDFERLFREECAALRAPEVRLQFPGRRGEAARRKTLAADQRLSDVLSEGEQKVIALADFLAEAAIRTGSAPILFDDPVNSLDYVRLDYIVDRLTELSHEHQVIVFTHNIWFATALLAKFEKTPPECSYFNVDRAEDGHAGVITGGTHPRWDTPQRLRPRINELIQNAESVSGEAQQALIESAYSRLRSWCEVVTEQDLFKSVTQRYRPNIMMTKLPEVRADRLAPAIEVISRIFEKACRVTDAHSQPLETLGAQPTLQDLKDDWKEAQDARAAYVDAD